MKIFTKEISIGDMKFKIAVDREITASAFEAFPEFSEAFFNITTDKEEVIKAVKKKTLGDIMKYKENFHKDKIPFAKYVFPKLLEKADKADGTDNASKADEIISYVVENDADEIFADAIFEFVCLGFTNETKEKKAKIKIAVK